MKKAFVFASRCSKEMLRDPLNLAFGLGFPLVVLLLMNIINSNIPVELFALDSLTPGIAVFGLSFISLFSATLISKDRSSSYLLRLFSSPMHSLDFILGYTMPLLPMAVAQSIICFLAAWALGLEMSVNVLLAIVTLIPASLFFIAVGLLCGSLLNDKQVGGLCGALLTNLTAWLSGAWFDLELVGGAFKTVADLLPFSHAVSAVRAALAGDVGGIFPHLWWVIGYALAVGALAVFAFRRKMSNGVTD